jgi:GNAT superfamily N-acetyltransferase
MNERTDQSVASISRVDSEHFGVLVARAIDVTKERIPELVEWCAARQVRLLVARSRQIRAVQAMEERGFRLMDVLVYYQFPLDEKPIPAPIGAACVRPCRDEDHDAIARIALASFKDYQGHYHNDPRLPRDKCDQGYADWARNSCRDEELAQAVFVAEVDGRVVAFSTAQLGEDGVVEGRLVAVRPEAQRRGLYRQLVLARMEWGRDRGMRRFVTSTQISNHATQKVWQRLGFEIFDSVYTLHRWFD